MANLHDGLIEEIERCAKLVQIYDELGPVGQFGKAMIQQDIDNAKSAMGSGDIAEMIRCYEALKECE
jgi:hypothetical protein